jgi:hypothetical protein
MCSPRADPQKPDILPGFTPLDADEKSVLPRCFVERPVRKGPVLLRGSSSEVTAQALRQPLSELTIGNRQLRSTGGKANHKAKVSERTVNVTPMGLVIRASTAGARGTILVSACKRMG